MPGIPIVMYDGTVLRTPELGKGMQMQDQYFLNLPFRANFYNSTDLSP